MTLKSYSSKGFVLAKKNYSEADRIITIYSQRYGKISLIAKGVRKTKSRKRGHLEIFSHISFSATKPKGGFDILTEAQTLDNYKDIRNNLKKVSLAYYFCEVVNKIIKEEENDEIYNIMKIAFKRLENAKELKKLRLEFIHKLLTVLGYWPKDKKLVDADAVLNDVLERNLSTVRVGKKLLV